MDGYAGIPQETRLLFRALCLIENFEVEGFLQHPQRTIANGSKDSKFFKLSEARKINKLSRVIVSLAERPNRNKLEEVIEYLNTKISENFLFLSNILGLSHINLTNFETKYFDDFVWRTFFSKTLPASDRELVCSKNFKICRTPWSIFQQTGLNSLGIKDKPTYPKLKTNNIDIFISQTPYPGRVSKNTKLVVRYHDAIPVFMPHTIPNKNKHQSNHFYALYDNVANGSWFACVSETTRKDLIKIFPEAESKSVTIYNMVSHHYFDEDSNTNRIPEIIRARINPGDESKKVKIEPGFLTIKEKENFYSKNVFQGEFRYLLIVSTIEPRKNHQRLIAAWEKIRTEIDPNLKLVIVGTLGWDYSQILSSLKPWLDRGQVFMLSAVPAPDLRILYKHAAATICPSLGEGFDFSGVEAMRSGGVVISSDIAVHREVYEGGSLYFDPYSTGSLFDCLNDLLYNSDSAEIQNKIRVEGKKVSEKYLPSAIIPQWQEFLNRISEE